MHIQLKPLLAVAFSLALLTSCQKAKTKLTDLPGRTQEGKNTFGCVLDGRVFIAQTRFAIDGPYTQPVTCRYGLIDYTISTTDHYFDVCGTDNKSSAKYLYMTLHTLKLDIKSGGVYPIQNKQDSGAYAEYSINYYNSYTSTTGELKITKFDEASKIASGTFWFDAVNDKGEKVEVRNGRFDAKIN